MDSKEYENQCWEFKLNSVILNINIYILLVSKTFEPFRVQFLGVLILKV